MNNLQIEILNNIFKKYKKGELNDLKFLMLVIECLNNYKNYQNGNR